MVARVVFLEDIIRKRVKSREPITFVVGSFLYVKGRYMRVKDYLYTNSEMERIIDEYIHSSRDRLICKMCFIDGITHEKISEHKDIDLTPRQVSNIISKNSLIIAKCLENRQEATEVKEVTVWA